jgi:hypothetical protein
MIKLKNTHLLIASIIGMLLVVVSGVAGVVNAQTSVEGGGSFEDAVKIEVGSYQGGSLEDDEMEYFYISGIKPGQKVQIKGTFAPASTTYGAGAVLSLYNEDEEELVGGSDAIYEAQGSVTISWLSNVEEDSYKYYLKVGCDIWDMDSYSLDVSLTDCYDASSQTDVADSFSGATSISTGTYKGYLSGEAGTDTADYYKVNIKKGDTLSVEVTPSEEAQPNLYIYDSDREEITEEYALNPGAILKTSLTAEKDDFVYVVVSCDMWCSSEMIDYSIKISGAELSEAGVEEADSGEEVEDEEVATDEAEGGILQGKNLGVILVVVGVVFILGIIAVAIVIYIVIKARKNKQKTKENPKGDSVGASPVQPSTPPAQSK